MKKRIESAESLPPPAPLASIANFLQMNGDAPKGTSLRKILITGAVFFLGCLGAFVWLSHSINDGKLPPPPPPPPDEACVHQTFDVIRVAVSRKPNVAKMNPESDFYKTYFMKEASSKLPKSTLEEMKRSFGITPSHRKTLKSGYGNCCYWFWVDNRENPKRLCIIAEPLNGDEKEWRYYLGACKTPTTQMMPQDYGKLSEEDVKKVQKWLQQKPIDEAQFFTLKVTRELVPPPNEACVHQTFDVIRVAVSRKPNVAKMNPESDFYKTYFMKEESSKFPKSTLEEMKRSFGITPSHRETLESGYGNCCYWFWVDNRENPKRLCIIAEPLNGDEKEWRYYLGDYGRSTTQMMSRDYGKLSETDVKKVQNWLLQDPIDESQFFTLKETIGPDKAIIIPPELKERLEKTMAAITDESKSKGWNIPSQEWIRAQWEKYGGISSDRVKFVHDGDWKLVVEHEGNVFDATFRYEYQGTALQVLAPVISEKSRKRKFDDIKDDSYGGNKLVPPRPNPDPITKDEFRRVFGVVQTSIREKFPNEVPSSMDLKATLLQVSENDQPLAEKIQAYNWMILEDKNGNRQILLCWKEGETAPTFYLNAADPVEDAKPLSEKSWRKHCTEFELKEDGCPDKLGTNLPTDLKWMPIRDTGNGGGQGDSKNDGNTNTGGGGEGKINPPIEALEKTMEAITKESKSKSWNIPSQEWIRTQWEKYGGKPSDRVKFVHDGDWKLVVEHEGNVFDATFRYEYQDTALKVLAPVISEKSRKRKFDDIKDDGYGGNKLVPPRPNPNPITKEEFLRVFGVVQTTIRKKFPDEVPSSVALKDALAQASENDQPLAEKIQAYDWMILEDKNGNRQILLCWKEDETAPTFYLNVADPVENARPSSKETWLKRCKKFGFEVGERPHGLGKATHSDLQWQSINTVD